MIQQGLVLFLFLCLILASTALASESDQEKGSVTVVGLGGMGQAFVKCFASKGYLVHAWNRSEKNRNITREFGLENLTVHEDLKSAVAASDMIIMVVAATGNLQASNSVIRGLPEHSWRGKTLIQYSSHDPTAIKAQEELVESLGAELIGGAIVGQTQTVCTSYGTYLVSSSNAELLEKAVPTLEALGPVSIYPGDVGYAALAYVGLIQSLQFGLAGHELTLLLMRRYGAPREIVEQYVKLVQGSVPPFFSQFADMTAQAVLANDYQGVSSSDPLTQSSPASSIT
jgi:3-hydroxyisobutyrate dehydrogenase-like beta-hydroxyacid dehydrogenase